jgi:hypothetical protein
VVAVFCRRWLFVVGAATTLFCATSLFAQDLELTTLTESGTITWASVPDTTCRVESCSSLDGAWAVAGPGLSNVAVTAETTSVQVPTAAAAGFVRVLSSSRWMLLTNAGEWAVYNATNTSGLNTKGYSGAAYDGRFIYFAPNYDGSTINGQHARALRYDTRGGFTNASTWIAYDASNTCGMVTRGYVGCVFDGRYVYYAPFLGPSGAHGRVLRYDVEGNFTNASSWCAYEAGNTGGLETEGYLGAVFDRRFVYFVPHQGSSGRHGIVLRYDTSGVFTDAVSWASYDAGNADHQLTKGYAGGVFDGRFVYFTANYVGTDMRDECSSFLRYDTSLAFTNPASWNAYAATNTDGLLSKGYKGGVFDGRYIYFAPDYNSRYAGPFHHGVVLRYDTQGLFTNAASWNAYDASTTDGLTARGFAGAAFDGRYVFFVPNGEEFQIHGVVLRYDTQGDFASADSWHAYDAGSTGGLETKGYFGAAFDGSYLYFVPMKAGSVHARVLRFRARAPREIPATIYGGSFF